MRDHHKQRKMTKRLLLAILKELSGGDLNTLDRFQNWALSQEPNEYLEIMKWSADYRKAELAEAYPMPFRRAAA